MTKFNPHGYTVIFDSSSLYGDPIARQICGLIEKYKTTDKVDLKVYIPEVVEKERETEKELQAKLQKIRERLVLFSG